MATTPQLLEQLLALGERDDGLSSVPDAMWDRLLDTLGLVSWMRVWRETAVWNANVSDADLLAYSPASDGTLLYTKRVLRSAFTHVSTTHNRGGTTSRWMDPSAGRTTAGEKRRAAPAPAPAAAAAAGDDDGEVAEAPAAAKELLGATEMAHALQGLYHGRRRSEMPAQRQLARGVHGGTAMEVLKAMLAGIGMLPPLSTADDVQSKYLQTFHPARKFWPLPAVVERPPNAVEFPPLEPLELSRPAGLMIQLDNANWKFYAAATHVGGAAFGDGRQRGAPLWSRAAAVDLMKEPWATPDVAGIAAQLGADDVVQGWRQSFGIGILHYAIARGDCALVAQLPTSTHPNDWARQLPDGQTAVHMLRLTPPRRLQSALRAIVRHGPPGCLNESTGRAGTPLWLAARQRAGDAVRALCEDGLGVLDVAGCYGTTALHWLAHHDGSAVNDDSAVALVNLLHEACAADPEACDLHGQTPLHLAISSGIGLRAAGALLELGADPSVQTGSGECALHLLAALPAGMDAASVVTNAKEIANIDARRYSDRKTALHLACEAGRANLVRALLECEADPLQQSGLLDDYLLPSLDESGDPVSPFTMEIARLLIEYSNVSVSCECPRCGTHCPCRKARRPCTTECTKRQALAAADGSVPREAGAGDGNEYSAIASHPGSGRVATCAAARDSMLSTVDATVTNLIQMHRSKTQLTFPRLMVHELRSARDMMTFSLLERGVFAEYVWAFFEACIIDEILDSACDDDDRQLRTERKAIAPRSEPRPGLHALNTKLALPTEDELHLMACTNARHFQPQSGRETRDAVRLALLECGQCDLYDVTGLRQTSGLAAAGDAEKKMAELSAKEAAKTAERERVRLKKQAAPHGSKSAAEKAEKALIKAEKAEKAAQAAAPPHPMAWTFRTAEVVAAEQVAQPGVSVIGGGKVFAGTHEDILAQVTALANELEDPFAVPDDECGVPSGEMDNPLLLEALRWHEDGGWPQLIHDADSRLQHAVAGGDASWARDPDAAVHPVLLVCADSPIAHTVRKLVNRGELNCRIRPEAGHNRWHVASSYRERMKVLGLDKLWCDNTAMQVSHEPHIFDTRV